MQHKTREEREQALQTLLEERIVCLDGAAGTYLQEQNLTAEDFGGEAYEGCNEYLVMTRPDVVKGMHRAYLEAGADVVETNTFGSTPLVLDEYELGHQAYEISKTAAELARGEADALSTEERPRFVAGAMGPTTKAISVTGGITFWELEENFHEQARGLVDGGVDYLLVETCQDTRNVKAALIGINRLFDEIGYKVPIAVSATIEPMGTMLGGQTVDAFYTSIMHWPLLYVGLNCATGPAFMTDHLRTLSELAKTRVAVMPNAGLPDEDGNYLESPEMMAKELSRFMDEGWVNIIAGCCGTNPGYIEVFSELVKDRKPREIPQYDRTLVSGIEFLEISDDNRPVIVGERTNAVGSRAFKRLIEEEKFDEASDIGRRQVNTGAAVVDVNLANPDRDEKKDMEDFLTYLIQKVKAPLMIDSTDAEVLEAALPYSQGKAIINSVNLEDGEERFQAVVPWARKFGAALVVGCIDEDPKQGMGVTRQRKLEIAERSYDLLVNKYGVDPTDIIWDPLVFPCATGDENYIGSAEETIEGIRLIKERFPKTKTVLGISNVSFGLPPAGREVLNAVFMYHCVQAGLDLAIVNSEKLQRFAEIPEEEKKMADDILFNRGEDPIAVFAEHFRGRAAMSAADMTADMSLDERLAYYILSGSKDGLFEDLDEKMQDTAPLEIINGPLMNGMDEVGRLFNDNKLIVAEVLQSAEAMKAAVAHLEPHMEAADDSNHGTVILATVKGDVHDIGKNLVDIIFSNNGYKVINLGIKIPPEQLIEACKEHKPDIIGLSGLLVKSAQQMVITADDLHKHGIEVPILVGGAALSRQFTLKRIRPAYGDNLVAYAGDAMYGLELANHIQDEEKRAALIERLDEEGAKANEPTEKKGPKQEAGTERSSKVRVDVPIQPVPDTDRHVMQELSLDEVWAYVNPQMLYGKHLGLRGNARRMLEKKDPKAMELHEQVEKVKKLCREGAMTARAMWQFFPATSEGNTLTVHDPKTGEPRESWDFPRQAKKDGLSLADFVLPPNGDNKDHVALFVTTAGEGISKLSAEYKDKGEYLTSHILQALALETAEAAAEWIHARLRTMWGFPDGPDMTMLQRFQAKYRGKRYSFGYPACPRLDDQAQLWRLLEPEHIGVELTDGFMMEPEASVSAIAFHHPDAQYFAVGEDATAEEDVG